MCLHRLKRRAAILGQAAHQRIRPRGLNHGDLRHPRREAQFEHLAEALAQRGRVAQIAAGHNQVVGHIPVEGLGNLEGRRLLPLQPVRIDRVEQVDRRFIHNLRQQCQAAVEVGLQLAGHRAVVHRLRELAPGDLAVGNQHQALQPGARGISGHRRRSVSGRRAGHPLEAPLLGHAHCRGHARVLEGAGRIHSLVLGEELVDPQPLGGARQMIERRIALEERHRIAKALQNRQQLAEAPYAGVVQPLRRAAPLPPQPLERAGIGTVRPLALAPAGVLHFKQVAAIGATEVRPGVYAGDSRSASKTTQLMQILAHVC